MEVEVVMCGRMKVMCGRVRVMCRRRVMCGGGE